MKKILEIICETPLFKNIKKEDAEKLLNCLNVSYKNFLKNDIIFLAGETAFETGIIIEGSVQIVYEDIFGNRNILSILKQGDLFGEAFSLSETEKIPVSAVSAQNSKILFINSQKILKSCSDCCEFHHILIENTVRILALKNVMLNNKIRYLSMRSIREKLLSYLSDMSVISESKEFYIPFNRQQLADFLCVDRSALSYQLSILKKEGILDYKKNKFKLLK